MPMSDGNPSDHPWVEHLRDRLWFAYCSAVLAVASGLGGLLVLFGAMVEAGFCGR